MADKVTGNPYEHKQSRRCETPFSPCSQNSNTCCIGCPNLHVECLKDCPACIWEVAYKAGQKSRDAELAELQAINESHRLLDGELRLKIIILEELVKELKAKLAGGQNGT
jgi:hypothetical protein